TKAETARMGGSNDGWNYLEPRCKGVRRTRLFHCGVPGCSGVFNDRSGWSAMPECTPWNDSPVLRRFQMKSKSLGGELVADRLLLTN
ncbi:MAG: hypothetical protein TQ37_07515, partial [Candidatus Synechococcus spongiarum 15L]